MSWTEEYPPKLHINPHLERESTILAFVVPDAVDSSWPQRVLLGPHGAQLESRPGDARAERLQPSC